MSTSGSFTLGSAGRGNRAGNDEADLQVEMKDEERFQRVEGRRLLNSEKDVQMCVEACNTKNAMRNAKCTNDCFSTDARSSASSDSNVLHELLAPRGPTGGPSTLDDAEAIVEPGEASLQRDANVHTKAVIQETNAKDHNSGPSLGDRDNMMDTTEERIKVLLSKEGDISPRLMKVIANIVMQEVHATVLPLQEKIKSQRKAWRTALDSCESKGTTRVDAEGNTIDRPDFSPKFCTDVDYSSNKMMATTQKMCSDWSRRGLYSKNESTFKNVCQALTGESGEQRFNVSDTPIRLDQQKELDGQLNPSHEYEIQSQMCRGRCMESVNDKQCKANCFDGKKRRSFLSRKLRQAVIGVLSQMSGIGNNIVEYGCGTVPPLGCAWCNLDNQQLPSSDKHTECPAKGPKNPHGFTATCDNRPEARRATVSSTLVSSLGESLSATFGRRRKGTAITRRRRQRFSLSSSLRTFKTVAKKNLKSKLKRWTVKIVKKLRGLTAIDCPNKSTCSGSKLNPISNAVVQEIEKLLNATSWGTRRDIMNQLSQMVKVAIPHFLVSKMEGWLRMVVPNTSGATLTQTLCFNLRKVAGDNQITVTTSTNAEFRVHKSRGSFKYPTKNFVYGPTITTFIMRDVKATAEEFEAMSKDVMASAQGNSMAVEDQGKKILSVRTKDGKPARCNPAFCDFKIVHCVHPYCRSASRHLGPSYNEPFAGPTIPDNAHADRCPPYDPQKAVYAEEDDFQPDRNFAERLEYCTSLPDMPQPKCLSMFRINAWSCSTCCCREGLSSSEVSHLLIIDNDDCGLWFSTVDTAVRMIFSWWRTGLVVGEIGSACMSAS